MALSQVLGVQEVPGATYGRLSVTHLTNISALNIGTLTTMSNATPGEIQNPLALEEQVCFALTVASRTVVALYRPLLEPMGLTHPQYLVMLALWEHEPLSVTALGRLLQLDPATLSPLLKRLEASGLLRRERATHDERSLALVLTTRGRALRAEAEKLPPAIVERLGMDVAEIQGLHRQLTRLLAATAAVK